MRGQGVQGEKKKIPEVPKKQTKTQKKMDQKNKNMIKHMFLFFPVLYLVMFFMVFVFVSSKPCQLHWPGPES